MVQIPDYFQKLDPVKEEIVELQDRNVQAAGIYYQTALQKRLFQSTLPPTVREDALTPFQGQICFKYFFALTFLCNLSLKGFFSPLVNASVPFLTLES